MSTSVATIPCTYEGCDRSFGSTNARDTHVLMIHEARDSLSWPCKISTCDATFGSEDNRNEHMRTAHPTGHHVQPEESAQADTEIRYGCHELTCRRSFPTTDERDEHYLEVHHRAPTPAPADLLEDEDEDPAGTVERTSVPPITEGDDTADDLSADAGSSPAPRSETAIHIQESDDTEPVAQADEPDPAPDASKGDEMALARVHVCEEPGCGRTFEKAQGLSMHKTRAHRGLGNNGGRKPGRKAAARKAPPRVQTSKKQRGQARASGSSTSDEGTKPEEDTGGEMPTLPVDGWRIAFPDGTPFQLSPHQIDIVEAVAFLRREQMQTSLQTIVDDAIAQAGENEAVTLIVKARTAREVPA